MPDMIKKYKNEIIPALQKKIGCKNVMQVPKLVKIVISSGLNSSAEKDAFAEARKQISIIAGQMPVITKARKNVANFKLRLGMPNGIMVTLRGSKMYEFLDRLVHNTLPRVRDFRGISRKGFDGAGNYNVGVQDITVFAEIDPDKVKYPLGLNITIVTNAKQDDTARELLTMLEIPFAE